MSFLENGCLFRLLHRGFWAYNYYVTSTMYCAAGVKCVYIGFGWVELELRLEARIGLSMNSGVGA